MEEAKKDAFRVVVVLLNEQTITLRSTANVESIGVPQWARDGGFWWNDPDNFKPGHSNLVWIPYHAILRVETSGIPKKYPSDD